MSARADVALHLLAQLPDRVRLRAERDVLARAYGVDDRTDGPSVDLDRPFAELADELGDAQQASTRRGDDTLLAGHRVAVITNLPMHYRLPLFAAMEERVVAAGGAQRILFLGAADRGRPWIPEAAPEFDHAIVRERGLREALRALEPTIIVAAGFSPVTVQASVFARRRRIPLGIWSGAIDLPSRESSTFRRLQRTWIVRRASFGIAYGVAARDYLRGLSPEIPVVIGRNTSVVEARPRARAPQETIELLAVARLVRVKGIEVVIEALRRRPRLGCRLTVVGDGPERERLAAAAAGDPRVVFAGALAPGDVRAAYDGADILVFPTRGDVFGHVIVEAMAAGLAVVTTRAAGAAADLCVDGLNSVLVDGHDSEQWAIAVERLVADPDVRTRLGSRAAATVAARWTLDHSADAMLAGLRLGALLA